MPPEEGLSLKSTPPEVSVVLPTGQDGVGASEDVEVWRMTTGKRKRSEPEEPLSYPSWPRGGTHLQLPGRPLTPKPCLLQLASSQISPCCPTPAPPHHTHLEISQ